ncbi:MAG: RagB/SusD family nutrient uptake outer membrane protein [Prolixibacteraceae bacterium]|nr:RagB/SusD family nutrient uptake outer membrane protein [Prolixibacteraceae bacterium]
MKTIKKYILTIATLASLFISGCTEEFLDIPPAGKVDELSFFTDTTNIDLMLSGVYNTFLYKENCDVYDQYRWWLGSVASDEAEAGGDSPTAWGEGYSFDDHTYTAEASILKMIYGSMFNGVSRASQVIEKLPEAKQMAGAEMNKKIDVRLGEAYFLRAAYYFILTRVFGGVPVVDHILLPSEYKTLPRGTVKEVYAQMEKDLLAAIPNLPYESEISVNDKGRVSKGAAQALLAKIYVYESSYYTYYGVNDVRFGAVQNRWKEAFNLCQEIIHSGEYELVGLNGETYDTFWSPTTNGFRYLFSVEGNNNRESIFAIQHIYSTGYSNYSYGCALNQFVGARALLRKDGSFPTQNDHAWGFWVPTHKLFDLFDANDVRRKVAIGQSPDSITGYPGDSLFGQVTVSGKKESGWFTVANTIYQATGLENFKYEIGPHNSMIIDGGFQGNTQNMYYIRYADVVLLGAEAAMMDNNTGKALEYFNLIRRRARNCGDGIHPADLTGTVTKQEIMDERAREFAMEGERYFDLVRWKEAEKEIGGSRMEWWENNSSFNGTTVRYEEKNNFFPLPAIETSKNNYLKQYSGW